jgi:hypothetical protein
MAATSLATSGPCEATLSLHSRSAKGQFSRSLAELLFAHHPRRNRALMSHVQQIRELSLEHMERAMQAPGFIARSFGEPCFKVLYGQLRRPSERR